MLILSNTLIDWTNNVALVHTAPRGGQKSKFENSIFGLKPSYLMLTIMFEPKNIDTSTFRAQNLTMSNGGFHLDV